MTKTVKQFVRSLGRDDRHLKLLARADRLKAIGTNSQIVQTESYLTTHHGINHGA